MFAIIAQTFYNLNMNDCNVIFRAVSVRRKNKPAFYSVATESYSRQVVRLRGKMEVAEMRMLGWMCYEKRQDQKGNNTRNR